MASFRDQILDDLDRVFFNLEDFADPHTIEGEDVICIVDDDAFAQIKEGRILGLIEADMIIYGKTEDMPPAKGPESVLNVDGREMIVIKWAEFVGAVEIALRQNRAM
jgi:hypothetical protein